MTTASGILLDYTQTYRQVVAVPTTVAASDAIFFFEPHGHFPITDLGEFTLDASLQVSIEGYDLGTLYNFNPADDLFDDPNADSDVPGRHVAVIPQDVWAAIIADGVVEIDYRLGLDSDRSGPADYMLAEFVWNPGSISHHGTAANDIVNGSNAPGKLWGDAGNDYVVGGYWDDKAWGGDGDDKIYGGSGDDKLWGGAGDDSVLYGESGDDRIWGEAGNDVLYGGNGHDKLWGGDGNDTLDGGVHDDQLWGGAGADSFVFAASAGHDKIYDFEQGVDRIDLTQLADLDFSNLAIREANGSTVISVDDISITLSGFTGVTVDDFRFA